MKSYTKYLDNVVEQILYNFLFNFSLNILVLNDKPNLYEDDIIVITYITFEHLSSQENLTKYIPTSNVEPLCGTQELSRATISTIRKQRYVEIRVYR